jgi:hypothetical protein
LCAVLVGGGIYGFEIPQGTACKTSFFGGDGRNSFIAHIVRIDRTDTDESRSYLTYKRMGNRR